MCYTRHLNFLSLRIFNLLCLLFQRPFSLVPFSCTPLERIPSFLSSHFPVFTTSLSLPFGSNWLEAGCGGISGYAVHLWYGEWEKTPGTAPGEAHKMPASVETKTSHLLVTLICNTLAKSNYVFTNSLSLHNTNWRDFCGLC